MASTAKGLNVRINDVEATKAERQIPTEISKLAEAVSVLSEHMGKLHDVLRPAMHPDASTEAELKAASPQPALCEVASLIRDQRERVSSLTESVQFLIKSLQV